MTILSATSPRSIFETPSGLRLPPPSPSRRSRTGSVFNSIALESDNAGSQSAVEECAKILAKFSAGSPESIPRIRSLPNKQEPGKSRDESIVFDQPVRETDEDSKVIRPSRSAPELSVRIPSITELDATIASWPTPEVLERRGSCDSDVSSIFSDMPCLSPSTMSSRSSPVQTPSTPVDNHFTFSGKEKPQTYEITPVQDLGIQIDYAFSPQYPRIYDYQHRSREYHDLHRHRLSRPRTPERDSRRGPLSPIRSAVDRKQQLQQQHDAWSAEKKQGHCNKKYHWVHRDYILYFREDLSRSWDEVKALHRRDALRLVQLSGEPEDAIRRTTSGLQAVFYRENKAIPAIDDDGNLLFNEQGEEYVMEQKVREQGAKHLGLIDRHPERVVYMNYWFVRAEDMERAKELGESFRPSGT